MRVPLLRDLRCAELAYRRRVAHELRHEHWTDLGSVES